MTIALAAVVHEAAIAILVCGGCLVIQLAHQVASAALFPCCQADQLLHCGLGAGDVGAGLVAQQQARLVGAGVEPGDGAAALAGAAAVRERERRPAERARRRLHVRLRAEHGVQRRVARDRVAQRRQRGARVAVRLFVLENILVLLMDHHASVAVVPLVLGEELVSVALDALSLGLDVRGVERDEVRHARLEPPARPLLGELAAPRPAGVRCPGVGRGVGCDETTRQVGEQREGTPPHGRMHLGGWRRRCRITSLTACINTHAVLAALYFLDITR